MATVEQPKPQANSRPTRAQPAAVIRYIPGQDGDPDQFRARRRLFISHHRRDDRDRPQQPSRFLAGIPDHLRQPP